MSKNTQKDLISFLKVGLPLAIGLYLLWHFYVAMDASTKEVFFDALKKANYWWIFLSLILGFGSHLMRAHRWKYLLEPIGEKTKFLHRYHALMIGYLVNLLIPRAGEATRGALLYRTDRVPFLKSFGTIISERMFDMIMLGIVFLIAIALGTNDLIAIKEVLVNNFTTDEGSAGWSWIIYSIMALLLCGVFVFIFLWIKLEMFRNKIKSFIKDLFTGVFSILKSDKPFQFIFFTVAIWGLYLLFFGICFQAFDETKDFPLTGIFVGFIAGTFGIMFTNGGLGAYPYLVGIVVSFYIGAQFDSTEQAEGIGKAVGMIIWLSQTVMEIMLGLISLVLLPRNYNKESDDKVGAN